MAAGRQFVGAKMFFMKVRDKRSELDYPRQSVPARCCGFPLIFASSIFLLNCRYEVFPGASKIADASQLTFGNSLGDTFNARLSRFRLVVSRLVRARAVILRGRTRKRIGGQIICFGLDFRNSIFLRRVLVGDVFVHHLRRHTDANRLLFAFYYLLDNRIFPSDFCGSFFNSFETLRNLRHFAGAGFVDGNGVFTI